MSIQNTILKQISDLESISLATNLLPLFRNNLEDKCVNDLQSQIKIVQRLQDDLAMAKTEKNELIDREKKLLTEIKMVNEWIEYVKKNTPDTSMKTKENIEEKNVKSPLAIFTSSTPKNIRDLRPNSFCYNIPFISEDEFNGIPGYMLGRLTLSALNEFINKINYAVSEKYELLSRPQNCIKKPNELLLWKQYKREEKQCIERKPFVSENLVAKQLGLQKFDKRSHSMITVLRHVKRIITKTNAGVLILFLNTIEQSFVI